MRIFHCIYQELEDSYPIIESYMSESFGMNGGELEQTFPAVREMTDTRHNGGIRVSVSVHNYVEKVVGG